jgi:ribosomal protein S18 acetylase RimI-like enzyme
VSRTDGNVGRPIRQAATLSNVDFELRPATLDDIPEIGTLVRRAEAHDRVPRVFADDELEDDFSASYVDLDLDTRVAVRDEAIVGWANVWHPEPAERLDRSRAFGEVAPEHRGQGVGRALLGWSVDRGRERLDETTHGRPRYIRVDAPDWLEDRHRLYRRFGFEAVRWNEMLLRDLDDLPAPPTPEGIRIEPWPETDEEALEVRNITFGDHWGTSVISAEVWREVVRGHGGRPDLSFVAIDEATDRMVGICLNQAYPEDTEVTGREDAIIATLGTLREVRGRGVASALIGRSLAAFVDAGFSHAALDVDSDNPTGARRLYAALGFTSDHGGITFQIALDD